MADRIVHLYERCLVPCAYYEEFWLRYVRYVSVHCGREETLAVYGRGLRMVGREKSALRLSYAHFPRDQGACRGRAPRVHRPQ